MTTHATTQTKGQGIKPPPGDATPPSTGSAPRKREPVFQIEVFRVKLGCTHHIRTLSPIYGGLFTHWYKGQSRYCCDKECNPIMHREEQVWKGYFAAQVWVPPEPGRKGVWKPVVFEITEALELDLREEFRRGQIWEVFRIPTDAKDNPPTAGQLLEEHDPDSFAPEFDIRNVLMNMYHTQKIDLTKKNPMPPRMFAAAEEAPPPIKLKQEVKEAERQPMTPEERQAAWEEAKRLHEESKKKPK